jgi:hypothetical protein
MAFDALESSLAYPGGCDSSQALDESWLVIANSPDPSDWMTPNTSELLRCESSTDIANLRPEDSLTIVEPRQLINADSEAGSGHWSDSSSVTVVGSSADLSHTLARSGGPYTHDDGRLSAGEHSRRRSPGDLAGAEGMKGEPTEPVRIKPAI